MKKPEINRVLSVMELSLFFLHDKYIFIHNQNQKKMTLQEIKIETLNEIEKVCFANFSELERKIILFIIENSTGNEMNAANNICDYLGIQRRENRKNIYQELLKGNCKIF